MSSAMGVRPCGCRQDSYGNWDPSERCEERGRCLDPDEPATVVVSAEIAAMVDRLLDAFEAVTVEDIPF